MILKIFTSIKRWIPSLWINHNQKFLYIFISNNTDQQQTISQFDQGPLKIKTMRKSSKLNEKISTYKNKFSLDPPIGSRLWIWLTKTASCNAPITNSLTTSNGNLGEYSWSIDGIGSLEIADATSGVLGNGEGAL